MSHTTKDLGLLGYKKWRESISLLQVGTTISFNKDYNADTLRNSIKAGQVLVIENIEIHPIAADSVYTLQLAQGKRKFHWRAEGIHRMIIDGDISII
jgi:hypothetical protein